MLLGNQWFVSCKWYIVLTLPVLIVRVFRKKNDRFTDFKRGLIRVPYSCGPTCSSLRVFLKENSKIGCWIVMQSTGLVISSDLQYVLESWKSGLQHQQCITSAAGQMPASEDKQARSKRAPFLCRRAATRRYDPDFGWVFWPRMRQPRRTTQRWAQMIGCQLIPDVVKLTTKITHSYGRLARGGGVR